MARQTEQQCGAYTKITGRNTRRTKRREQVPAGWDAAEKGTEGMSLGIRGGELGVSDTTSNARGTTQLLADGREQQSFLRDDVAVWWPRRS